jgi:hypothetical protein
MRSRYRELGLELVSLDENFSRTPKIYSMEGENKDDDIGSFQKISQGIPRATEERDDG